MKYQPDFDPYLSAPEGDLTSGRGLLLLELARRWRAHHTNPLVRLLAGFWSLRKGGG